MLNPFSIFEVLLEMEIFGMIITILVVALVIGLIAGGLAPLFAVLNDLSVEATMIILGGMALFAFIYRERTLAKKQ